MPFVISENVFSTDRHSSSSPLLRIYMKGFPPGGSTLQISDLQIPSNTKPFPGVWVCLASSTLSPQFMQGGPFSHQSCAAFIQSLSNDRMSASISFPCFIHVRLFAAQSSIINSRALELFPFVCLSACWSICTLAQRGILNARVRYGPFCLLLR